MLVVVEQIPDDLRTLRVDGAAAWVRTAAERALDRPVTSVSGEMVLTREKQTVNVVGDLLVSAPAVCERCGEDCTLALTVPVDLVYEPTLAPKAVDEDNLELSDDDLDVGFYANGKIELEDVVCEAIALALPPRVVCDDVAACETRTAALLAEKGASGSASHPGFAALKQRFS